MKVVETSLPGVLIVEPRVHEDARGFFTEVYNEQRWRDAGLPTRWMQDNRSRSRKGVLRGLHFQNPNPQGKLVSVVSGEVFDVALDVRIGSPTFGQFFATVLTATPVRAVYLPPGFAHGLVSLVEDSEVAYKCDTLYDAAGDGGVRWNDPALGIPWPLTDPILSDKDRDLPTLAELAKTPGMLPLFSAHAAVETSSSLT